MKRILIMFISLVLVSTACTSSTGNESTAGELTIPSQWKLVSYGKSGSETPVIQGSTVTLLFEARDKAGGTGGCNTYGGSYELQGDALSFKDINSTLMACADEQVTQQEQTYFQALQTAARFEIKGANLTIFYDGGQSKLNFVKEGSG